MSATSTRQPSYRLHRASGQAVVTIGGSDIYLGKFGSKASKAEYDRRIAEWLSNGRRLPQDTTAPLTVAEVIERYWPWVETHYRRADGTSTSEVGEYRYSLRPLNHLYGSTQAASFGPLAFKALRQLLITGYSHPKYGEQRPQLRHNAATALRKSFGVEIARIILGHSTAFTTEIYAEADRVQAMEVIGKIG